MVWCHGPCILELLEEIHIGSDENLVDVRFPVQSVIRPHQAEYRDFRGYPGTVAGGVTRVDDEVMVLPSGFTTRVASIETADGRLEEA